MTACTEDGTSTGVRERFPYEEVGTLQNGRVELEVWVQMLEGLANNRLEDIDQMYLEDATEDAFAWAQWSR